ncbi:hypothetical protein LSAT2_005003 [Lamellibrachia satsuma]|nr:hypothetical protein LSAT2_005003 [Lamellibrachia satsuma]
MDTATAEFFTFTDSSSDITSTSVPKSKSLSDQIKIYSGLELLVFGLCGNAIIMLVLRRDGVRRTPATVFLFCMALADTATLILGLLNEWLYSTDILK